MSMVTDAVPALPKRSSLLRRCCTFIGRLLVVIVVLSALGATSIPTYYYAQKYFSSPHATYDGKVACAVGQNQVVCINVLSFHGTFETLPNKNTYLVIALLFGGMATATLVGLVSVLRSFGVFRRKRRVTR